MSKSGFTSKKVLIGTCGWYNTNRDDKDNTNINVSFDWPSDESRVIKFVIRFLYEYNLITSEEIEKDITEKISGFLEEDPEHKSYFFRKFFIPGTTYTFFLEGRTQRNWCKV